MSTIDTDRLVSELYAMIYADLYDEIYAEVVNDISEERFQQILSDVITDIYQKIDSQELSVEAASLAETVAGVAVTCAPSVVGVSNYDSGNELQAVGSGVIYKKTGSMYYVVTNHHVIEDGVSFKIRFVDEVEVDATVVGFDETSDLAVLTFVSDRNLVVAEFGDSDQLMTGSVVLAVGHPSGYDYFSSITMGIVSGTNRYFDVDNDQVKDMFVGYIQHDAAINSGNSGGALFDLDGKLIGINVIKIASIEIEGMGFAIPSSLTEAVVHDIEEFGYSKQIPGIGITFVDLVAGRDDLIQDGVILPDEITAGFYIQEITPGSSADGYILPGDIILNIDGIEITNSADFAAEFSRYHVGDVIYIVVYRSGSTLTINDIELKSKVN